ncbi:MULTISPECIES: YdbC family protein [Shewanella]|uniref:YdbC family protein n=1 Tax=unclassified Shewanella TaxID=196818 RepID=UPI0010C07753|nr:YdbC family protein [Shewanella sp. MEBiC00475]
MTIAKLIICDVNSDKRGDFSTSQCSWAQLSNCDGFGGQAGGWEDSSSTATILGFWESQRHVGEFMKSIHDEIFKRNNQESTYNSCSVDYFELISIISGSNVNFSHGGLFSIIYCSGVTNLDKFTRDQEAIWNSPRLQQSGMLSAHIWRHITLEDNYMVVSHWESKNAHEQYLRDMSLTLRPQACPSDYVETISSSIVELETLWSIVPNKQISWKV